jgi:hypothetical protein
VFEEPAFAIEAARIAGKRCVGADHAVTGHDDRNRILRVRVTYGAACRERHADAPGQLPVRDRGAGGNAPQFFPHARLKRRTAGVDGERVDGSDVSTKVCAQRAGRAARIVRFAQFVVAVTGREKSRHAMVVAAKVEGAEGATVGDDQNRADR